MTHTSTTAITTTTTTIATITTRAATSTSTTTPRWLKRYSRHEYDVNTNNSSRHDKNHNNEHA
jgi:hypothetical protein